MKEAAEKRDETREATTSRGGAEQAGVWTDPTARLLQLQQTLGNAAVGQLLAIGGSGKALDPLVRVQMEGVFGADLGGVSIHHDRAVPAAVGAEAATIGREIYVDPSALASESNEGERLLAHEIAHVVQQADAPVRGDLGFATTAAEAEAGTAAAAAVKGEAAAVTSQPRAIARQGRDGKVYRTRFEFRFTGVSGNFELSDFKPAVDLTIREWIQGELTSQSAKVKPASITRAIVEQITRLHRDAPVQEGDRNTYRVEVRTWPGAENFGLEVELVSTRHSDRRPKTEASAERQREYEEQEKTRREEVARYRAQTAQRNQVYRGQGEFAYVTDSQFENELARLRQLAGYVGDDVDWTETEQRSFWDELGTIGRAAGRTGHAIAGRGFRGPPDLSAKFDEARRDVERALDHLDEREALEAAWGVESAVNLIISCEEAFNEWVQVAARGAGKAVAGLTWVKGKSRTAIMLGTMFLPGSGVVWGAARGALWAGGTRAATEVAEQASAVAVGLQEKIRWGEIAGNLVEESIPAFLGGLAGGYMSNALTRVWGARLSRVITDAELVELGLTRESFVTGWNEYMVEYFSGTLSTPADTVSRYILSHVRSGEPMTMDEMAAQILDDLEAAAVENTYLATAPFINRAARSGGGGGEEGGGGGGEEGGGKEGGGGGEGGTSTLRGVGPEGPAPGRSRRSGRGRAQTEPGVGPEPPAPARRRGPTAEESARTLRPEEAAHTLTPEEAAKGTADTQPGERGGGRPRPARGGQGKVVRRIDSADEALRIYERDYRNNFDETGRRPVEFAKGDFYEDRWRQAGGTGRSPPAFVDDRGFLIYDLDRVSPPLRPPAGKGGAGPSGQGSGGGSPDAGREPPARGRSRAPSREGTADTLTPEEAARTLTPEEEAAADRRAESRRGRALGRSQGRTEAIGASEYRTLVATDGQSRPSGYDFFIAYEEATYTAIWSRSGGAGTPPEYGFVDHGRERPLLVVFNPEPEGLMP